MLAKTTGIITSSFVTFTGFVSPLGSLTTRDPELDYRLFIYSYISTTGTVNCDLR
jgi:hypothetical protein